jgi:phage terminase large subunit GpA-like protein
MSRWITQAEYARHRHVSKPYISKLAKNGVLVNTVLDDKSVDDVDTPTAVPSSSPVALYAQLKITEPGPGFCHFPIRDQYDLGYFEQLTAETCHVRYSKGFAHREWTKKAGARNEALDACCYAYAALQSLIAGRLRLNKQAEYIEAMIALKAECEHAQPVAPQLASKNNPEPWIEPRRDWLER